MTTPNTPRGIVEAVVSCRPMIERQIVEQVGFHCGLTKEWAAVATANALTELIQAHIIEMFHPGPPARAYRITAAVQVEKREEKERGAKEQTTKKMRAQKHPIHELIARAKAREGVE